MKELKFLKIQNFKTESGWEQDFQLSYQVFGRALGEAPVVLVNHALTGNSNVTGENGWWSAIIGEAKTIDTQKFSVLAFNIPGNGYSEREEDLIYNYRDFTLSDIASLLINGVEKLNIKKLFAIIGCSVGGALTWEMAALKPHLAEHIIPVAADYKATDWVLANCRVQEAILKNSKNPIEDARMHAMTFYRTPESLNAKFQRKKDKNKAFYEVHSWLNYHGKALKDRYKLPAYLLMNHLLMTIDITKGRNNFIEVAGKISAAIHLITVNSDSFFLSNENWETYVALSEIKGNISIGEIKSIHGHDAFLIENSQVQQLLQAIFNHQTNHEKSQHRLIRNR